MKKIFFLFLCCLTLLCGCANNNDKLDKTTGQIICTLAEEGRKNIISVEHQSGDINVIISSSIEKHDSYINLLKAKEWFDYDVCELGETLYCNSYILEEQLIIVEETAFIPKEDITETESYINYVEENGYTCMTLKDTQSTKSTSDTTVSKEQEEINYLEEAIANDNFNFSNYTLYCSDVTKTNDNAIFKLATIKFDSNGNVIESCFSVSQGKYYDLDCDLETNESNNTFDKVLNILSPVFNCELRKDTID